MDPYCKFWYKLINCLRHLVFNLLLMTSRKHTNLLQNLLEKFPKSDQHWTDFLIRSFHGKLAIAKKTELRQLKKKKKIIVLFMGTFANN